MSTQLQAMLIGKASIFYFFIVVAKSVKVIFLKLNQLQKQQQQKAMGKYFGMKIF